MLKGNEANPGKIVRWLKLYEEVAPDILGLTTTALLGPDVDVTPAVRDAILAFAPEPA